MTYVILEAFKVMGQVELVVISGEFFSEVSCPAPHGLLRRALSYACEASMVLSWSRSPNYTEAGNKSPRVWKHIVGSFPELLPSMT